MQKSGITPEELDHYQSYIGHTVEHIDTISRRAVQILAATLDADVPEDQLPSLWHYGLFLSDVPTSALDQDGHPRRGDFLPPVRLPRRMFAGSTLRFDRPLSIGRTVARTSRIMSVDHRKGKSGDLVFVRVAAILSQDGEQCVEEQQTIVYRSAGGTTPAVQPTLRPQLASGEIAKTWLPTTTELFRYSAATFNSHRIHYDGSYVTEIEGYPGLVVHGPLIATRLCAFAAKIAERDLATFAFRGEVPCFVQQEIRIVAMQRNDVISVRAERADGETAMSATATTR